MVDFLENLPSRGKLRANSGSIIGGSAVNYLCNHETDPPENQVIKADEEHILSKCLQKARVKEAEAKKKQRAEKMAEQGTKRKDAGQPTSNAAAKRQSSGQRPYTAQQLRPKQNQELVDICRGLGLPVSGKKDVLVQRILNAQESKENR